MQPRERLLAGIVGAIILAYGGYWLFQQGLQGPKEQRHRQIQKLNDKIHDKEQLLARARKAGRQLTEWRSQSLPSDVPIARTLYQGWLVELVGRHHFQKPNVDSGDAIQKLGIYQKLPFTVRGQATLQQVVDFLYEFYRAGHLHRIQRLNLTPLEQGQRLSVSIAIEALVLPGADRKDTLTHKTSNRLAYADPRPYQVIVERNVFGRWGTGRLTPADHAYLTAILDTGGRPEVWITLRTTGELLKLHPGDPIEVGTIHGEVAEIASPDVVLKINGSRWLLTLGDSLSQAMALPPEY